MTSRSRFVVALLVATLCPRLALAHPGSGIVADRRGEIYFIDTGAGVWKIDGAGALSRIPGPNFHWLTIDADGRFGKTQLPTGTGGDIARVGVSPALFAASDFPLVIGADGGLNYPQGSSTGVRLLRLMPSGQTSVLASIATTAAGGALRWVNGLAAGPEGSLYFTENDAIRRISAAGEVSIVARDIALTGCVPIPGTAAGEGPFLRGLAVDATGTAYVAASGCGSLLKVTPGGEVTSVLQLESPWSPTAVALFAGDVYVLEYLHSSVEDRRLWIPRVRKISPAGKAAVIATVKR